MGQYQAFNDRLSIVIALSWVLFCSLGVTLWPSSGLAYIHTLPTSLVEEVLSESVPTAFAPTDLEVADFALEWVGEPIADLKLILGEKSLEWVRVAEFVVLPRARLVVSGTGEGGVISNRGYSQSFAVQGRALSAEIPIALISGERNPIEITILRGGNVQKAVLHVRFKPRQVSQAARIYTDPSCSSYRVRATSEGMVRDDTWMYVGCRLVYVEGSVHRTSSLEMFVYWDNVGQVIELGGVEMPSVSTSTWALRQSASPGKVLLKARAHEVTLTYGVAEHLRLGFLGVGVGPYGYTYDSADATVNSVVPLITLYGSFFVTESMRIVAFNATALHRKFFSDFGIYLNSESIKTLDRRIILNVMLGAHVIGFNAEGKTFFNIGAPQGMELIFKDAFYKGYNFTAGAFVYPPIHRKLYYNAWLRFGAGGYFAEINYIAWQEVLDQDRVYNRSFGLTFGMPLARFY